jgi:hypothetical protein
MKTKPAKKPTAISPGMRISRRGFVGAATALTFCPAVGGEPRPTAAPAKPLARDLSPTVQMQFMRPAQLEAAIRAFGRLCSLWLDRMAAAICRWATTR